MPFQARLQLVLALTSPSTLCLVVEMQEVIVHEGPRTAFAGSPIPKPGPDQIVIRVDVAGCNPKDYKTYWFPEPLNQGNDVAGYVHEVGSNVVEFKVRRDPNVDCRVVGLIS